MEQIKRSQGITLIALIVTIIVLLILARSKYRNANRRERNFKASSRSKKSN